MRRSGVAKFPNSVQLFKFCQKVLADKKDGKVHDQEIGGILKFNPSDCSHWKRGEKNIKSVFALSKLAKTLGLETSLIHDVASGASKVEEAYFEYVDSLNQKQIHKDISNFDNAKMVDCRNRIDRFVQSIHNKAEFSTPPLYLPEVLRFFPFIAIQPIEMLDKLSRILRKKPGQYMIHFSKGDLKPQTRMSMTLDLTRIILEGERDKFPEFGPLDESMVNYEKSYLTACLLVPKDLLIEEVRKLDPRKNIVSELATLFWVPKSLICQQLREIVCAETSSTRDGSRLKNRGSQQQLEAEKPGSLS